MTKKNVTIRMSDEEREWHSRDKSLSDQVRYDTKLLKGLLALVSDSVTAKWSLEKSIAHVKKMIGD